MFQDRRVYQNISSGIILSGQSLVLQGITRHYSGSYTCQVSNSQGETTSNLVILRVKCKYLIHEIMYFTLMLDSI